MVPCVIVMVSLRHIFYFKGEYAVFSKDMVAEEQKFQEVKSFLDSEILRLGELIEEYKNDIKVQGEDFNMDNPNGGMYSGMELTEVHYEMEKKMLYSQEATNDIYFYKKLRNSPYFARVDFKIDGALKPKTVYIGLKTLQDPDSFEMYVCDWRAPIASLFYEDFEGKAYFEAPKGKIEGDLMLKRQYKFQNGCLYYYVDSDIKIDDVILRDVLSQTSGEHLKVIVNSIQREQNKAVRYSDSENLLVLGPAGSGKTSVGFHRLAYLLYRNRNELASSEIVMFSNNDIFSSYVADIIPELGEMPINYASFYSIFNAEIPAYNVSDYYALADEVIMGDKMRGECARIKMSKDFLKYLDYNGNSFTPEFSDIKYENWVIVTKDDLDNRYYDDDASTAKAKGERLVAFVHAEIDRFFEDNKREIYDFIDRETSLDEDTAKTMKRDKREIKAKAVDMVKNATLIDPVVIYFGLLKKYAEKINTPQLLKTAESLNDGYIEFEDALGVVYLKTALGTAATLTGVKHMLIDEAQDLALIQHEILKRMFPRARVTLLADTNQAILPEINTVSKAELAKLYNAKTVELNKSYRSTQQINGFAISLLPQSEKYEIFNRDGKEVEEKHGTMSEFISYINSYCLDEKTGVIIAKTAKQARELYRAVKKECPTLRLCDNKSCTISNNPVIMPLALTKGLEFDSVIIADENGDFTGDGNQRFLYLAATRALHSLTIYSM